MKIFNDKTVVALFDADKNVEKAVAQLQAHGFGSKDEQEIQIVDKHRLSQEMPINVSGEGPMLRANRGVTAGAPATVYQPAAKAGTEAAAIERSAHQVLFELGLNSEEAAFFARHVARGNSLVIVDTTKERANEALNIVQQFGVKASTA